MKYLTLLLLLCLGVQVPEIAAQRGFQEAMQQARSAFDDRDYETALKSYRAAQAINPALRRDIDREIDQVFSAITQQRDEAIAARREAENQRQLAEQARMAAVRESEKSRRLQRSMQKANLLAEQNIVGQAQSIINVMSSIETIIERNGLDSTLLISAWTFKADAYKAINDYDKVIFESSRLLAIDSLNLLARQLRLIAYFRTNQDEKGLADANFLLSKQPLATVGWMNKPFLLTHLGRYTEAKARFRYITETSKLLDEILSVEINEVSESIRNATGSMSLHLPGTEYRDVMRIFYEAIPIFEGGTDFFDYLTSIPDGRHDLNVYIYVIHHLQVYLKSRPQEYGAHLAIAALWDKISFSSQARKSFDTFRVQAQQHADPKYAKLYQRVPARLAAYAQSIQGAEEESNPKNLALQSSIRSFKYAASERNQEALSYMLEAVEADPQNLAYLNQLAYLQLLNGQRKKTLATLDTILAQNPGSSAAYGLRAFTNIVTQRNPDYEVVVEDIKKAFGLNPFDTWSHFAIVQGMQDQPEQNKQRLFHYHQMFRTSTTAFWIVQNMRDLCEPLNLKLFDYIRTGIVE